MNVFSSINHGTKKVAAPAAGAAALSLTIAAIGATPAEARVLDTDRPRVTASNHDFGKNWVVSAPQTGGTLTWDLTDGVTTASLSGYHYLSGRHCGRVYVQYYNDDHTQIGTDSSATKCAPGSGKTQWWITESFASTTVTHVHVSVQHQNSNGSYSTIETDIEDFD
jgi:hypothetical protein